MQFPQFVGSAYRSRSANVAAEELCNWQIERTESPTSQAPFPAALVPTPGLRAFAWGLQGPVRGLFGQDGRAFAVAGSTLYELQGDGTTAALGTVAYDFLPATFASNGHGGHQLAVTSGGFGYIYDLISGVFTQITDASFPPNVIQIDYLDGYFLALASGTSTFSVSALEDGLNWEGDSAQVSSSSDQLLAMRVIQRTLWLLGSKRAEVWVDSGGTFPFAPIPGALIETGIAAPWAVAEAQGTLGLIGQNEQGAAIALQSNGYQFQEISTHHETRLLSVAPDLANTLAWSYQENGHSYFVFRPTAGPSLVYDLRTGIWHNRGRWNASTASYDPMRQSCHCYAFGKHLVGDATDGVIYEQSLAFPTDDGEPIRRLRTAPHVNQSQQWYFGSQVALQVETGQTPEVIAETYTTEDGTGSYVTEDGSNLYATELQPGQPAQSIALSWSKDGGHTYSAPIETTIGPPGRTAQLVKWNRAPGRFADLVLRATTEATVPVTIFGCDLRVDSGTGLR